MQSAELHTKVIVMSGRAHQSLAPQRPQRPADRAPASTQETPLHDAWVVTLHLRACRKWLASSPPAFEEVERTFRVISQTAKHIDTLHAYLSINPGAVARCSIQEPRARLEEMGSRLDGFERALLQAVPVRPRT